MKPIFLAIAMVVAAGTASADQYAFRECNLNDGRSVVIYVDTDNFGNTKYKLQLVSEDEVPGPLRTAVAKQNGEKSEYTNGRLTISINEDSTTDEYSATAIVNGDEFPASCGPDYMERF